MKPQDFRMVEPPTTLKGSLTSAGQVAKYERTLMGNRDRVRIWRLKGRGTKIRMALMERVMGLTMPIKSKLVVRMRDKACAPL
eukprot:9390639-Pyramimonas_sp.AAC.1